MIMNVRKRGLALLMCICMVFTLLPFLAFADETAPATEVPAGKAILKSDGATYETLDAVLAAAKDDDTIYLGEGEYSLSTATTQGITPYKDKNFTFVGAGSEKTKWIIKRTENNMPGDGPCDYSFDSSNSITFEEMTLISGRYSDGVKTDNYQGFVRINNITLKDCIFNGRADYWGYNTTTFDNVIFNAPGTEASGIGNDDYSLWTWTGMSYTFNNCTFNASGKIIHVYREGSNTEENPYVLNFKNCTVNSSKSNKSVLNIKDNTHYYNINISGTNDITGLKPNGITCSRMFQVEGWADNYNLSGGKGNGNNCRATVNIDGKTVWENGKMVSHEYTDGYKDNAFDVKDDGNTVTKTCKYCGWSDSYTKQDWNINVSKTATELKKYDHKVYSTDVTLSVPSVEENLASDVVLVLDASKCAKDMLEATINLLKNLEEQVDTGANIKVGIVMFKGNAVPFQTLTKAADLNDLRNTLASLIVENDTDGSETKKAVRAYVAETYPEFMNAGTNIPAGLQLAKNMLEGDTTVTDARKYMVLVSDGDTYLFCHETANGDYDYTKSYTRAGPSKGYFGGIYENNNYDINVPVRDKYLKAQNSLNTELWQDYLNYVGEHNQNFTKYDFQASAEAFNANPTTFPEGFTDDLLIPESVTDRIINSDVSRYQTASLYTELQAKYNCYYCFLPGGNDQARTMLQAFTPADRLIDGAKTDTNIFSGITKEILYAVSAGSTVTDTIGKDFTFGGVDSFTLKVGKTEVTGNVEGNTVNFGDQKSDGSYPYTVTYTPATKTFVWTINENVSNFEPVQLTYTLKLTEPATRPGTYGQLDLNGDTIIDRSDKEVVNISKALYTNEFAKLTPVDSFGHEGLPVPFPMPSVEYTVRKPVDPSIRDKITVEITGNSDSVVYDGTEHSVKDYTVKISDSRYTEADFTFSGKALASGINAGTYEMGLKADQFKNINARFKNVEFIIKADGVLTITQRPLTITAGSAEGIAPVTCDKYTVEGLATGDKVDSVKITGIQSEPGESPNVASDAVIKNAKGEDVTANYKITYVDGVLKAIEVLNKEIHFNYVIGYTDGTIRPSNNISRAEVATIFFRLLTDEARTQYDKTTSSFSDIKDGAWCCRAVSTLTNMGIIKGYTDGTFRPNADITRAELATIIARFAKLDVNTKTFSDINGHWAQKSIELAAGNGWINGYTDGTFHPNKSIIRAETFAMINRVLDRQIESVSDLLPTSNMNMWSDNMDADAWYYKDVQEATNYHKCDRVGDSVYEKWTEKVPDIDWASYQI